MVAGIGEGERRAHEVAPQGRESGPSRFAGRQLLLPEGVLELLGGGRQVAPVGRLVVATDTVDHHRVRGGIGAEQRALGPLGDVDIDPVDDPVVPAGNRVHQRRTEKAEEHRQCVAQAGLLDRNRFRLDPPGVEDCVVLVPEGARDRAAVTFGIVGGNRSGASGARAWQGPVDTGHRRPYAVLDVGGLEPAMVCADHPDGRPGHRLLVVQRRPRKTPPQAGRPADRGGGRGAELDRVQGRHQLHKPASGTLSVLGRDDEVVPLRSSRRGAARAGVGTGHDQPEPFDPCAAPGGPDQRRDPVLTRGADRGGVSQGRHEDGQPDPFQLLFLDEVLGGHRVGASVHDQLGPQQAGGGLT